MERGLVVALLAERRRWWAELDTGSIAEAQSIFEECGLSREFWRLAPREGEF
jgi:hypothetical protein